MDGERSNAQVAIVTAAGPSKPTGRGWHNRGMANILVTGFEPFGGDPINPSLALAQRLDGWKPRRGHRVVGRVLPCRFGDAIAALEAALDELRPTLVIAIGLATGREGISVERIAINVDDARIPDNGGAQPIDEPVVAGAPAAYFSGLPIKAIVQALLDDGFPASVSQTAGTFVCNHVFFGLMHLIAIRHPGTRGGFVHVPCLPEQAPAYGAARGLPIERMDAALRLAVATALATKVDLKIGAGAID